MIKIKTIGQLLDYVETKEKAQELIDYIDSTNKEIERLKQLLEDSYKSAHPIDSASRIFYEKDKEIEELNNRIEHALDYIECANKVDITYVCKILKGVNKQ